MRRLPRASEDGSGTVQTPGADEDGVLLAEGISVVVPTRGNAAMVRRLLVSLVRSAQELPPGSGHEIVVVDDSEGAERDSITEACASTGAHYVSGPRRVGAKRNVGVEHSRYPVILFIDSDCVATSHLLSTHLRAHATATAPSGRVVAAVAGPTVVEKVDESSAWRAVKSSVVVNSPFNWPASFREVWWAATANLSVDRGAFLALGGFDPRTYTVVGGEDVDLGVRLHAAGYTTVCSPEAVVIHEVDGVTTVHQFRRKMFLYGRACVYNCVRQREHARWSANPFSLLGLAWLVSAAAPRPRTTALLSTAAVGAWFGAQVWRANRRDKAGLVAAASVTSVDWAFQLGITAEAVSRGRPTLAMKRYEYFQKDKFVPAPSEAVPDSPDQREDA